MYVQYIPTHCTCTMLSFVLRSERRVGVFTLPPRSSVANKLLFRPSESIPLPLPVISELLLPEMPRVARLPVCPEYRVPTKSRQTPRSAPRSPVAFLETPIGNIPHTNQEMGEINPPLIPAKNHTMYLCNSSSLPGEPRYRQVGVPPRQPLSPPSIVLYVLLIELKSIQY